MIEYLNHLFIIKGNSNIIYNCKICGIEAWHNRNNNPTRSLFFTKLLYNNIKYNVDLKLTCEEIQIKNLLE
jgi:hypothetical protein